MKKRSIFMFILVIVLITIDQLTKWYGINFNGVIIENILNFTYAKNTGGAFGIGGSNLFMVIISNVVVLGIIIRFMFIQKDRIDKKTDIFLCMVLAGGFSNLLDRIIRGYVVDFIQWFPKLNLPLFNIADIFIVIGWLFLAMIVAKDTITEIRKLKRK